MYLKSKVKTDIFQNKHPPNPSPCYGIWHDIQWAILNTAAFDFISFSAPRPLWKQDEGEVQQLWGRGEERKAKTMSTMYNPGDREWQTFQRHPGRIKMITPSTWFFHQHKLSPIFRKIQKYFPTLVSSTIQLRSGAKLYAALESIWIHIEKSFQAFNLQLKLSIGATKYSTQKLKT